MFESLLKNQVQNVMKILGQTDGLAPAGTFEDTGTRTYDTATRTYVSSGGGTYENIPMVLARFSAEERDGTDIQVTDLKVLIAFKDMPTGVVPDNGDQIVTYKGTFNVERNMGVPGDSLYILQVRQTNPSGA